MKFVTFNIRSCYDRECDGIQSFVFRAGLIRDTILKEKPDVVAFQEVTEDILSLVKTIMPDYTFYGHGRLGNFDGEGVYTAVRNDTQTLLGLEVSWLSPTPYVPASRYDEQSQCPRTCCETLIKDNKSGKVFYVFNIHLDHIETPAQGKQLLDVVNRMKARHFDYPVILAGDFNLVDGKSEEIDWLRGQDIVPVKQVSGKYETTFHGFGKVSDMTIDYIFATDGLEKKVTNCTLWEHESRGIFLSDHYPVCAEFELDN